MAYLPESPVFDANIYRLEATDPLLGAFGELPNQLGELNLASQALTNRTAYLKEKSDVVSNQLQVQDADALSHVSLESGFKFAVTMGALVAGDGGGGCWMWDATSTATHNVGTVIQPSGPPGSGRWLRVNHSDRICASWFGAQSTDKPGYINFDSTSAIQAALDYAASFVVPNNDEISGASGGATIHITRGMYNVSDTLLVAPGVSLIGDGIYSTVIQNITTDKTLIKNSFGATYNATGSKIADLSLYGSRSSSHQWAIELLRGYHVVVSNVYAQNTGAGGFILRQCLLCNYIHVIVTKSAGAGLVIEQATVDDQTWPTNACFFSMCHMLFNDGPGLRLNPGTNGCTFNDIVCEYNYHSSGNNAGHNIELLNTNSYLENYFINVWVEGPATSHILSDALHASNRIENLRHGGNGADGYVDRAVIVTNGLVDLVSPCGIQSSYKSINNSISPFRVVGDDSVIQLYDPSGCTLTHESQWVENANGAGTGLEWNLYQGGPNGVTKGRMQKNYMDHGYDAAGWYCTGDAKPKAKINSLGHISFGPGGNNETDVTMGRRSAGVFGPVISGMNIGVDGLSGATLLISNGFGGNVTPTLGSNAPAGATAGDPATWILINVGGTDRYIPCW